MKKIYISGKITGDPHYKTKFMKAAQKVIAAGYTPINPATVMLKPNASWKEYMQHDIKLLVDCDGILMLPDWKESKGATLEKTIAESLGIRTMEL